MIYDLNGGNICSLLNKRVMKSDNNWIFSSICSLNEANRTLKVVQQLGPSIVVGSIEQLSYIVGA